MKWNRLIDKVLKRPEEPAQRATTTSKGRKGAPKGRKKAGQEPGSTEDQWLRVLEEAEPDHNPYDTYTWELDPGTEERKLKRKRFGAMDTHPPKDETGGVNPYDTGANRGGGWDS